VPVDSSQILLGLFRDRTWVSTVRGRRITARAGEWTKKASFPNIARDSHERRSIQQQQHNGCPAISEQVACKKLLITSRAPVPVPFLSYAVLTFKKSRIPPHTSEHKHGTRKYISVLCNEVEHHEPYDIVDGHRKFSTTHCSHKVGI
jgi:hypothetical protein